MVFGLVPLAILLTAAPLAAAQDEKPSGNETAPAEIIAITLGTVMVLIVAGGLGFLTLEEVKAARPRRDRVRPARLSLHSRLVLATTAVLLVGGWIAYAFLEWNRTLEGLAAPARGMNALFMSVTARTAGFNTVDYAAAAPATNFFTIILMSIGGSPGSMAGGLKTTTIALIGLLAWSRFRGRDITTIWGRSVPEETVQRAVGLFAAVFGLVTLAILAFAVLELGGAANPAGHDFLDYMFEATSAFNTVGLSTGVTAELSGPARGIGIALMFIGRVGPLTFAAALAMSRRPRSGRFRFAYEDVIVG